MYIFVYDMLACIENKSKLYNHFHVIWWLTLMCLAGGDGAGHRIWLSVGICMAVSVRRVVYQFCSCCSATELHPSHRCTGDQNNLPQQFPVENTPSKLKRKIFWWFQINFFNFIQFILQSNQSYDKRFSNINMDAGCSPDLLRWRGGNVVWKLKLYLQ